MEVPSHLFPTGKSPDGKHYEWPNGARLALSLVVNVEEGAEGSVSDGDRGPEPVDELGISLRGDYRNLGNESNYRYGIDEGAPRILGLLNERKIPATFTSAALALERSPELARSIVTAGHEICAHGYRWVHQYKLNEDEEREFISRAAKTIEATTGQRPRGWLSRYLFTENTRRLLVEEGFSYHMDDYSRDEPFWSETDSGPIIVVPYALDSNDMKMWTAPGYTPEQWLNYALDTFRTLYQEGAHRPRMMSLGLHLRVIGRPGRINMLARFLDRIQEYSDVWVTTRSAIADHFSDIVDPPYSSERALGLQAEFESIVKLPGRVVGSPKVSAPAPTPSLDIPQEETAENEVSPLHVNKHPDIFIHTDPVSVLGEFPVGEDFVEKFSKISRDEISAIQQAGFARSMARAWEIPFYQRLWGDAGIKRGDIESLADIDQLPVFDKDDLMTSIEAHPPWGDYHGISDFSSADRAPVTVHTTSGTTGKPQIIPFGPRTRMVQNLLLARTYRLQGLKPEDIVQSVYGHGLVNGGHYIREAVTQWTGARFLSAGTGLETPSERQLTIMRDFNVTVLLGFPDYLMKLATLADTKSADVDRYAIRLISGHLGNVSRQSLSDAWNGAEVYDWYGVGDTGVIAAEGPGSDGLYVMEDAHYLEILDVDSNIALKDGDPGNMVVTCLFKEDVYPIIRFNTHDVSAFRPRTRELGLNLKRIEGFLGRSDNMVKLKGINIFPDSIGGVLGDEPSLNGEYQCRLVKQSKGEIGMVVHVESKVRDDNERLMLLNLLRRELGVSVDVVLERPGALSEATGLESRQKPIRFRDDRNRKN